MFSVAVRHTFLLIFVGICRSFGSFCANFEDRPPRVWNPNATVMFGQSADFSGPAKDNGEFMRNGILGAFKAFNKRNSGITLGLISYDDGYCPIPCRVNTRKLIDEHAVFSLIGYVGTATAQEAVPLLQTSGTPFLGPFTGARFLRYPFKREVVNYRASYDDETAAMVRFFVVERHLDRISIFIQNDGFGEAGKEGVILALRDYSMMVYTEGRYEKNQKDTVSDGLNSLTSRGNVPQAVIMIGTFEELAYFVELAKTQWGKAGGKSTLFSTVSFVGPHAFVSMLNTTALRDSVLITQTVPSPHDRSHSIVVAYQSDFPSHSQMPINDFTTLEGYIVARLATEMLAVANRSGPLTKAGFLNVPYSMGVMHLGDFVLGPYGGSIGTEDEPCNQLGTGCDCNQGMRRVFGTKVAPNGDVVPFPELDYEFYTCGFSSETIEFNFGQICDSHGTEAETCQLMRLGIIAAFKHARTSGELGNIQLKLTSRDDGHSSSLVREYASNFVTDNIFGFVSSVGEASTEALVSVALDANVPIIGALSGADLLREPFNRNIVNLRASLADETAALIDYFIHNEKRRLGLFLQRDAYGLMGKKYTELALRRHGLMPLGEPGWYTLTGSLSASQQEVDEAIKLISGEGSLDAVVIIGSAKPTASFIRTALLAENLQNFQGTLFGSVSRVGSEALSRLLAAHSCTQNVIISQVVPLPTVADGGLVGQYHAAMREINESSFSFASLEGYMLGRLIAVVVTSMPGVARQTFVSHLYDFEIWHLAHFAGDDDKHLPHFAGGYSSHDVGPFREIANQTCNQGLRHVYLTSVRHDGTFEYVPEPSYGTFDFQEFCGLANTGRWGTVCWDSLYRSNRNDTCSVCPQGAFVTGDVGCAQPPTNGQQVLHDPKCRCEECPAGSFGDALSSFSPCTLCIRGRYGHERGNRECAACPAGSFNDDFGAAACMACPLGKYGHGLGQLLCIDCLDGSFTLNRGSTECLKCPTGGICSPNNDGLFTSYVAEPGFYRMPNYTKTLTEPLGRLFPCHYGKSGSESSCLGDNICAEGMTGIVCGTCLEGFGRAEAFDRCEECPNDVSSLLLVCVSVVMKAGVVVVILISMLYKKDSSKPKSLVTIVIKQLINYAHMVVTMQAVSPQTWFFEGVGAILSTRPPSSVSHAGDCLLRRLFPTLAIHKALVSVGLVLIPIGTGLFVICFCVLTFKFITLTRELLVAIVVLCLFVGHPVATQQFIVMLDCVRVDELRLTVDPSYTCFGSDYYYWRTLSYAGLLLYSFGIPMLLATVLKFHATRHMLEDPGVKVMWGFLYNGFNAKCYYFEVIFMLRKVLFQICIFTPGLVSADEEHTKLMRATALLIVAMFFFGLQVALQPYDSRNYMILDRIECGSLRAMVFSLVLGIWHACLCPPVVHEGLEEPLVCRQWFLGPMIVTLGILFFHSLFWYTAVTSIVPNPLAGILMWWWKGKQSKTIIIRSEAIEVHNLADEAHHLLMAAINEIFISIISTLKRMGAGKHYRHEMLSLAIKRTCLRAWCNKELVHHLRRSFSWERELNTFWKQWGFLLCFGFRGDRPPVWLHSVASRIASWNTALIEFHDKIEHKLSHPNAVPNLETHCDLSRIIQQSHQLPLENYALALDHRITVAQFYEAMLCMRESLITRQDVDFMESQDSRAMQRLCTPIGLQITPSDRMPVRECTSSPDKEMGSQHCSHVAAAGKHTAAEPSSGGSSLLPRPVADRRNESRGLGYFMEAIEADLNDGETDAVRSIKRLIRMETASDA